MTEPTSEDIVIRDAIETINALRAQVLSLTEKLGIAEGKVEGLTDAVKQEREACAKIADVTQNYDGQVAALIRARGGEK